MFTKGDLNNPSGRFLLRDENYSAGNPCFNLSKAPNVFSIDTQKRNKPQDDGGAHP